VFDLSFPCLSSTAVCGQPPEVRGKAAALSVVHLSGAGSFLLFSSYTQWCAFNFYKNNSAVLLGSSSLGDIRKKSIPLRKKKETNSSAFD